MGWTVKKVDEGALSLESAGKEVRIALREFKAPAPAPAKARRPGTGKPRQPIRSAPPSRVKRN
jgi:hypothetical protein